MKFDLTQSNIAKGVAVLLLLWHHLFGSAEVFEKCFSLFRVNGQPVELTVAVYAKVCVSVFLFISGYGLYLSYLKYSSKHRDKRIKAGLLFVIRRYLKIMKQYWVVYIVFVPLCLAFGKKFYEVYAGNPLKYLADFFGVTDLFFSYTASMNPSWWYISLIISYIIIFPVLFYFFERFPEIVLLCSLGLTVIGKSVYLSTLVFGMLAAKTDLFTQIVNNLKNGLQKALFAGGLFVIAAGLRFFALRTDEFSGTKIDFLFGFSIIIISYFYISNIPYVNKVFESIGKRSGLIYMFHTFILSTFFNRQLYSLKYPVLIFFALLISCYFIALLLECAMKYSGYNKLFDKLIDYIGERI